MKTRWRRGSADTSTPYVEMPITQADKALVVTVIGVHVFATCFVRAVTTSHGRMSHLSRWILQKPMSWDLHVKGKNGLISPICWVSSTVQSHKTLLSSLISCAHVESENKIILIELLWQSDKAYPCLVLGKRREKDDNTNRCIQLHETVHRLSESKDPPTAHGGVHGYGQIFGFWHISGKFREFIL